MREYMAAGLKRDCCLEITGLTKNQFYYVAKGTKSGRAPSKQTLWRDPSDRQFYQIENVDVIQTIVGIKLNPDLSNWYRLITIHLQLRGYYINHKKVYRLMKEYLLLEEPRKRTGRNFVKFRRVAPTRPLQVIEMDIKYVWIYGVAKYAYILTIIDTFTRYVLYWTVGYAMKSAQVKASWEYVIANYLQPAGLWKEKMDIEVRNDNGKQFNSKLIHTFFEENHLGQVFTHPYSPEENGHIESFHNTLGKALSRDKFTSLGQVEGRLKEFYGRYNNDRSHSSIKGLPPAKFWALFDMDKIEIIPLDKRRIKFELKVAYQEVLTLPDIHRYDYRAN